MLKRTLIDSSIFFLKHWKFFFLVYLPIFSLAIIFELISLASRETIIYFYFSILSVVIMLIANTLFFAICIFYIAGRVLDSEIEYSAIINLAKINFLNLLILTIYIGFVTGIGLILLIVPGVIFYIKMSFSAFELLFNNFSPIESMKKSWHQTTEYFGLLLGGMLIIAAPVYILFYIIFSMLPDSWMIYSSAYILYLVIDFVVFTLITIFCFRIYDLYKADMRAVQEDSGLTNINAD